MDQTEVQDMSDHWASSIRNLVNDSGDVDYKVKKKKERAARRKMVTRTITHKLNELYGQIPQAQRQDPNVLKNHRIKMLKTIVHSYVSYVENFFPNIQFLDNYLNDDRILVVTMPGDNRMDIHLCFNNDFTNFVMEISLPFWTVSRFLIFKAEHLPVTVMNMTRTSNLFHQVEETIYTFISSVVESNRAPTNAQKKTVKSKNPFVQPAQ